MLYCMYVMLHLIKVGGLQLTIYPHGGEEKGQAKGGGEEQHQLHQVNTPAAAMYC